MEIVRNGEIGVADSIAYSVIVPVYNVEKYVAECLESILLQGRDDFEVIVVDDGSTDSSGSICDGYQAKNPEKVKVIHKSNEGPLLARRRGYASSRGRYLLTVDSDDMLMPGSLDAIDAAVQQTGADVIQYGFTRHYGDYVSSRARTGDHGAHMEFCEASERGSMLRLLCEGTSQNSMWAKAVRRSCAGVDVDYSRYSGMTYAEDFLQTVVIYDRARTFCRINVPLYFYRRNPESSTGGAAYVPGHYPARILALDAAQPFVSRWERELGIDGLMRGLACQGLCEASKYAVYLAQKGDDELLKALRNSEGFRSRFAVNGALNGLRADQKLEVKLLAQGRFGLLKTEAAIKGHLNHLRGR